MKTSKPKPSVSFSLDFWVILLTALCPTNLDLWSWSCHGWTSSQMFHVERSSQGEHGWQLGAEADRLNQQGFLRCALTFRCEVPVTGRELNQRLRNLTSWCWRLWCALTVWPWAGSYFLTLGLCFFCFQVFYPSPMLGFSFQFQTFWFQLHVPFAPFQNILFFFF